MTASALRKVASQIRHRLSDMELRTNASAFSSPGPKDKTSGYVISEVADWQLRQWLHIIENTASGMEAPSGGETENTGSTEGDSPVPQADAPKQSLRNERNHREAAAEQAPGDNS